MRIAATVRHEKDAHPERFCRAPRCLWRVTHPGKPNTPCPKHPGRAECSCHWENGQWDVCAMHRLPHSQHTTYSASCLACEDAMSEARALESEAPWND